MVTGADLVIAMAREHAREAVVLDERALAKTFTLKELVRLGSQVGPRPPDEPLSDWLTRVAAQRSPRDLLGVGHDDRFDVADPVGMGPPEYEATAALLDDLLGQVVSVAWPADQARAAAERAS